MLHNKFNGFLDKSRATIYKKNKIKSGLVQRDKPNKRQKKWWKHFAQPLNALALINFWIEVRFRKANFRDITQ